MNGRGGGSCSCSASHGQRRILGLGLALQCEQQQQQVSSSSSKSAAATSQTQIDVKDANGKVNWKPLEECACQTKPACAPWVSSLSAYIEQNSGGPKGELIQDLADYAKSWSGDGKSPQRVIGGEFFNKVVSLNFGSGAKYPYIKTAIVEAQLASPPDKMQDNFCRLMIPSCLMELTRKDKRQLIDRAENMMTEARSMVNSFGLTTSDRIRLVGLLDVRLILHILKKGKEFEPTVFKSMDDIIKVGRPHTHAYIHIHIYIYSHTNGVRALNPLFRYPVFFSANWFLGLTLSGTSMSLNCHCDCTEPTKH